jgi:vacuolar-type H+-ATPase subunit E/Vma4
MSLENIRQTVMKASESEAQRIINAAKKQAEQQLASQKNAALGESERLYEAKARSIDENYGRRLIQIKGKNGKELLEKRNATLREIFDTARQTILNWPDDEYRAVMKRLVERVVGQTGGVLRVHREDSPLFQSLVDELNIQRDSGSQLSVDREYSLPERGGFIFISAEFEIDQTLKTIMDEIERELLPVIARELFSQ